MLDAWRRLDAAKAASPGTTATSSTSAASTGSGDTRDDAPDYRGRRPAKRKGRAFTDIIYLVVSDELRTKMALKLVYPFVAAYVLTVALLVSLLWTLPDSQAQVLGILTAAIMTPLGVIFRLTRQ